jgi:hypothetical protein
VLRLNATLCRAFIYDEINILPDYSMTLVQLPNMPRNTEIQFQMELKNYLAATVHKFEISLSCVISKFDLEI